MHERASEPSPPAALHGAQSFYSCLELVATRKFRATTITFFNLYSFEGSEQFHLQGFGFDSAACHGFYVCAVLLEAESCSGFRETLVA